MASPASAEANDIRRRGRRRLIGAIAIAVLLVVFVPMILDSQPRGPRNAPVADIPSKDNAPPLPPPAKPSTPPAAPTPEAAVPAGKVAPAAPAPVPASVPPPPAPASSPAQAKAAEPALEGFAVQVGAFKDEDKLKQARDKLAAAGIKHYIERRDAQGGLTRLRAGPYATRDEADKAAAAIKAASLDAQVVPLP